LGSEYRLPLDFARFKADEDADGEIGGRKKPEPRTGAVGVGPSKWYAPGM